MKLGICCLLFACLFSSLPLVYARPAPAATASRFASLTEAVAEAKRLVETDAGKRYDYEFTTAVSSRLADVVGECTKDSSLLTVVASSAVAAGDRPEDVIGALYKTHRPWEHKELNLANRAVLLKYFSPGLTKLFLKNAQVERDCPEGDLCGIEFDPILGSQDFDDHLRFNLRITQGTPPQANRFEAHFKLFNDAKTERVVVFRLVPSKNGWRIDDIIYPAYDNASLKVMLTALP